MQWEGKDRAALEKDSQKVAQGKCIVVLINITVLSNKESESSYVLEY